jgi:hypothetical protein
LSKPGLFEIGNRIAAIFYLIDGKELVILRKYVIVDAEHFGSALPKEMHGSLFSIGFI